MNRAEDVIHEILFVATTDTYKNLGASIANALRAAGLLSEWVSVADAMPKMETPVMAVLLDGKLRSVVRVAWIPRWSVVDDGNYEGDDVEYNEEKDEYFWPEGWYEWNEQTDMNYRLSGTVTHWQAIAPPKE